ncbi:MAG TPA: hypothetical protein VN329_03910, partial [Roseomonas sp.]|nr:hypothetical protein [Roseomonas sp.]
MNGSPRLLAPASLLRRWPHLPAFWPCAPLRRGAAALPGDRLLLAGNMAPPIGWGGDVFRVTP